MQLKIYFCTQLQNDCIFEWFKLKILLIKVVVLMVKNQTTLSSFQNYFFEMNNEKKRIISPTISNFQLSASAVIRTSVVPLSLSLRRASAHCSIKISYEKEQNLIIETTFTYVFCIFLQKNCNWKYIFVFNYKIIAYLLVIHKIFKMFVILYN